MSIARRLAIAIIAAAIPLAAHAGTFTTLYTFTGGTDGGQPSAQLVYQNGTLYGATYDGSPGNIFAIDTATGTLTVVYKFTGGADGRAPNDLIYHGGIFYGTTVLGGANGEGTVFALNAKTGKETILYSFPATGNGNTPSPGGLIYESGMLYGVTTSSGNYNYGLIFAIDPRTRIETNLFSFDGADGLAPNLSLVFNNGLLYGTTETGGPNTCKLYNTPIGCGVVFGIDPSTSAESTIYSFTEGADGFSPASNLIYHKGLLYGGTELGGNMSCGRAGCGTLFNIDPATGAENVLDANTRPAQGANGLSDQGASIYETISGYYHYRSVKFGELVKFDLKSGHEAVLHKFTNGADGGHPLSPLTYGGGAYYGSTTEGAHSGCIGNIGCGTTFKYVP